MPIENLTLIGERINPGFAASRSLLENRDLKGIRELAAAQTRQGAHYLTINVGTAATEAPAFLTDLIRAVQEATDLPLSFDHPGRKVQELCLRTYDPTRAKGRKPIVNSISELRLEMLDLLGTGKFRLVLMASERLEGGRKMPNTTASEIHVTAKRLVDAVLRRDDSMSPDDLLIDVSLGPLATDMDGGTRRSVEAIRSIGSDPDLKGVHMLVGLSNLSIMLPKTALDGSPLKARLESAFLTMTMPLGLDTILGTPSRDYQLLDEEDFVYRGFREALECSGFDLLVRLQRLYLASGS